MCVISTLVRHYYEANISNKAFLSTKKKKTCSSVLFFSFYVFGTNINSEWGQKTRRGVSRYVTTLNCGNLAATHTITALAHLSKIRRIPAKVRLKELKLITFTVVSPPLARILTPFFPRKKSKQIEFCRLKFLKHSFLPSSHIFSGDAWIMILSGI